MKTIASILSRSLAAGTAGVALLTIAGLVPADFGFASLATLGLVGIALFDYTRPVRSLHASAPVLRPSLPGESNCPIAYSSRRAA